MEKYFVISNGDGDTYISMISKEELLIRLNENYWGEDVVFFDEMPSQRDTNYWGEKVLIIKGEVAVPKAKEVITSYDI